MALACLAVIEPLDLITGLRKPVRVSSAQDRRITGLGGKVWEPAMLGAPELTLSLFNGDFTVPASVGGAQFKIAEETLRRGKIDLNPIAWNGAPIAIYAAEPGTMWPWPLLFKGSVREMRRDGPAIGVSAEVDTEAFDKKVLTLEYKGTAGDEGGMDLKNRVKPLVIGRAKNVEPVPVDVNNSVYQFSGYGPIEEVTSLFERASDFGSSVGDFSSYSTLVAQAIPPGRWATCLAEGLIRLGAPPAGVITGNVRGHAINGVTPRLTGDVIRALADIAGVDPDRLDRASLDTMDIALPYPIGLVLTQQVSFMEIARRLALACNHQAAVALTGTLFVVTPDFSRTEALTLDVTGRASPQVLDSTEMPVSVPYWKHTFGAARNWRVQTKDEIAFWAELVEAGLYNPDTYYREGNIVSMEDGSRFLYINTTPTKGNAPPNATYWGQLSGALGEASNIIYKKATTKPATPSPSADVPSTWVDDIGDVGAANQPTWASYGRKLPGSATYEWQTPYNVSADARLFDGLDGNGAVKPGQVGTGAIVNDAVTTPWLVWSTTVRTNSGTSKVELLSATVQKATASSLLEVSSQVPLTAGDEVTVYVDFDVYSGASLVANRRFDLRVDGNGNTNLPFQYEEFFSGLSAGIYTITVSITAYTGETCQTQGKYHLRVREYKR